MSLENQTNCSWVSVYGAFAFGSAWLFSPIFENPVGFPCAFEPLAVAMLALVFGLGTCGGKAFAYCFLVSRQDGHALL